MSTLELAIVLPALMMLLVAFVPVVQAGVGYMIVSRAASAGLRYASRVDENARRASTGELTRRPSGAEVDEFVRDAASPLTPTTVETRVSGVVADPSSALPGETVTVGVTYEVTFGPLATLVNAAMQLVPGGPAVLPMSKTVSVTSHGREE